MESKTKVYVCVIMCDGLPESVTVYDAREYAEGFLERETPTHGNSDYDGSGIFECNIWINQHQESENSKPSQADQVLRFRM